MQVCDMHARLKKLESHNDDMGWGLHKANLERSASFGGGEPNGHAVHFTPAIHNSNGHQKDSQHEVCSGGPCLCLACQNAPNYPAFTCCMWLRQGAHGMPSGLHSSPLGYCSDIDYK